MVLAENLKAMGSGDIAATIVRFVCHLALSDPPGSAQVFFSNTQGGHWKRRSRRVPPWELGSAWEEDWTWWTEISTPIPYLHAQMHVAQQSSSSSINNSIPRQEQQLAGGLEPGGGDGGRAKLDAMACLSVPAWHGMAWHELLLVLLLLLSLLRILLLRLFSLESASLKPCIGSLFQPSHSPLLRYLSTLFTPVILVLLDTTSQVPSTLEPSSLNQPSFLSPHRGQLLLLLAARAGPGSSPKSSCPDPASTFLRVDGRTLRY
ncbi:hypothetical protein CNYM01_13546 [Colletotrichum nymphaeae SA-01]|uniref:Uncharacterized protein n=1 Tax=Colletotrichum nymphaeae SA-01 TaxID=1460502 RepID=A0A135RTD8_9PEZI|nr:hypothetical protein CNYM01_13546 [Colletotrichum nymphaeae SA-01]